VGSSLFYLAEKLPSVQKFTGISISNKQVATANHHIPAGMEDRIQFVEGDFLQVSDFVQQTDIAFSIEAFAHSENALEFFKEVGKIIPPKGRLVIIDDVLTEYEPEALTADHSTLINTYKACWLLPSLHSLSELQQFSEKAGFALKNEKDLTALLKIRRPRDRFISFFLLFLSKLADYSYYWKSLKGGDAKQRCYQKGLTAYKCLVFEKE
jgi:cyclopropane fatty-acyl-phospholipid synthase-like methyltransferase